MRPRARLTASARRNLNPDPISHSGSCFHPTCQMSRAPRRQDGTGRWRVGSIWVLDRPLTRFPKFFSDNSPNGVGVDRLAGVIEMLAERLINHRLVAPTRGVGASAERVEHRVVDVNRDPRLPALANDRAALAVGEVVCLLHIGVFRFAPRAAPR